jgi:DNA-binding PadR family transcriptional regulator
MVLGLLSIRDWTSYELAAQMKRGFADIWENSRSMVFQEPKVLLELGLAKARSERVGRRERTRYAITPKGRKALAVWLAEPGAAPAMHFEGLLKVLLADLAEPQTLAASLAAARQWSDDVRETGRRVAEEYADGEGPFPERVRLVALSHAFLWDFAELVGRWASWAEQEVEQWPEGDPLAVFQRALAGKPAFR